MEQDRSSKVTLHRDKESRQVRVSWKAAARQRKGWTLRLLSPGAAGAGAGGTDGRGNGTAPSCQECPSLQVNTANPSAING